MLRWFVVLIVALLIYFPGSGQEFEFSNPVSVGQSINSGTEESSPLLSVDGKTLYFSRAFDPRNVGGDVTGMDIWVSKKDVYGRWGVATNAGPSWNNKGTNAVIGVRDNNTAVYLLNSYKNKSGIAFSKFSSNEWSEPEIISIPGLGLSNYVGYYVNPTFTVILVSMNRKDSYGEEDLYVCTKDSTGTWSRPLNLGPTINTKGFEISPFLSPDGQRIYFSSNGHPGLGDADIYYSDRLYGSWQTWTSPRSIGDNINSSSFDAYFSIYGDSVAYFSSNRNGGLADIYTARVGLNDNVFDKEKNYLTPEEVASLIGSNIDPNIKFNKNSSELTAAQNELLFYIVNKIITQTNIKIQLNIRQGETQDFTAERMKSVADKLKSLGITASRIDQSTARALKTKSGDENVVKMMFFK